MPELDALLAAYLVDHLATLEELNPWRADALCKEYPHLNWFPGRGERVDELRQICGRCLVQRECREYALAPGRVTALDGVWGGTSRRTRRQAREGAAA